MRDFDNYGNYDFGYYLYSILTIVAILCVVFGITFGIVKGVQNDRDRKANTIVTTDIVTVTVTHADAVYKKTNSWSGAIYMISIFNKELNIKEILYVDSDVYVCITVGDTVSVKRTATTHKDEITYAYEIIWEE